MREESRGIGGGLIHFELSGHFDLIFFIGEGDGGEEVGRLVGARVTWDLEGVEPDGEGEILQFKTEADAGGGGGGGEDGGGA